MKKSLILIFTLSCSNVKTFKPEHYIAQYNMFSPIEQKTIQTILFDGCAFGRIKKENKNPLLLMKKAFQLWQEVTTYTHIKLLNKINQKTTNEKNVAKKIYTQTFEELQKIIVPQSKHFFESSNIIKTIKNIPYLNLQEEDLSYFQKITNFFKNLSKKSSKTITHQLIDIKTINKKEALLEFIQSIILEAQKWLEQTPKESYLSNPFCLIKNFID
jgi:hypothetical protein